MAEAQQANKERLLEVATDLFSTKGFKGTSIRNIARDMGMSISNIYHYFGNKEGLMLEIVKRASLGVLKDLRAVSEKELDPYTKFKLLVKTHAGLCKEYWKENKIFLMDEEHMTPEILEINIKVQREIYDIYLKELKMLKHLGIIKKNNLAVQAFNTLGVINWQLRWYRPDGRLGIEELSDEIVSFILYGITGEGDETG